MLTGSDAGPWALALLGGGFELRCFFTYLLTNLHQPPTQPHLLGIVPLHRRSRKNGAGQIQECGGVGEQPHE